MSIDAIRDALVGFVQTAAKTQNVYAEDDFVDSAPKGESKKRDGGAVHWWVVSVDPIEQAEGIGFHEKRYRLRIVGTYGRDRERQGKGEPSDKWFRRTVTAVLDALTAPQQRFPGGCIDTSTPRAFPVVGRSRQVGGKLVACHEATIEYEAQEE